MHGRVIAVKLGGSILTSKGEQGAPQVREENLKTMAKDLAGVPAPLVITIGGGAFGHPVALAHGIGVRNLSGASREAASAAILRAMDPYVDRVVKALAKSGLPVLRMDAHEEASFQAKRLQWNVTRWKQAIEHGKVPVTAGTVVADDELGLRILSADELMAHACQHLGVKMAVFATDVDGLLEDGKPVAELSAAEAEAWAGRLPSASDATGGMAGKLMQVARMARSGADVAIVHGGVPGRILAAATGKATIGTRIRAG